MGEGFGGYKAFVIAILALVFVAMGAPDVGSNFAPLRTHGKGSPDLSDFAATPEEGWPRLFTGLLRGRPSDGAVTPGSGGNSESPDATPGSGASSGSTGSNPGTTNAVYPEDSAVPSDFDVSSYLRPSWGSGAIPITMGADPVGAFRFICGAGQVSYDDPMVYPGRPGASHLHQFYGNTSADANSTYASLRQSGEGSCGNKVNRSAYWMPALLDGRGHVIQPDYVSIYYKRLPASDPHCNDPRRTDVQAEGICIPLPNGLRFTYGYDMLTSTPPTGHHHFSCIAVAKLVAKSDTLAGIAAMGCPPGDHVEAMITAPDCWDGKHLDSQNHRDHVTYGSYGGGYLHCPADHPYLIPAFTLAAFYSITPEDDLKRWHFSSDEMVPGAPAGTTFHADWFGAWDNTVLAMWTDNCINKHLNCSGGDLGNGLQIKGGAKPWYGWSNPNRLTPIPSR